MDYINQMADIELAVIKKPRVYIKWKNTELGRDKTENYERIEYGCGSITYVNVYNSNIRVTSGLLYDTLEDFYKKNYTE